MWNYRGRKYDLFNFCIRKISKVDEGMLKANKISNDSVMREDIVENQIQTCINVGNVTIMSSKVDKQVQTMNESSMSINGHYNSYKQKDPSITSGKL